MTAKITDKTDHQGMRVDMTDIKNTISTTNMKDMISTTSIDKVKKRETKTNIYTKIEIEIGIIKEEKVDRHQERRIKDIMTRSSHTGIAKLFEKVNSEEIETMTNGELNVIDTDSKKKDIVKVEDQKAAEAERRKKKNKE